MEIINHEMTELRDPTGIIGDRYEFLLDIEVDEEDELYTDQGLMLRVIIASDGQGVRIIQYFFVEKQSGTVLGFALEDEEEQQVLTYCNQQLG
ncbi:DUF6509 family protein [Planococcus lenghuensis]|uniref:Pullulanase n=1 Tax=Planococcus lenghuensis TaxID=2213202 RepID=A0A1Q2KUI6_9BACL|nr:DUF6509 family protein [Planococcus lenghuensis]AQQ51875.1 pullulanase [Planococcus lenghuensis]